MPPKQTGPSTQTVTNDPNEVDNSTFLERAMNFFGDEDIHRNFDFVFHLEAIDEKLRELFVDYISPRKTKTLDFDVGQWEWCNLQCKTHKEWIAKERAAPSQDWAPIRSLQDERANILSSSYVRPSTGATIIPPWVSDKNPALPPEVPLCLALSPDDPARRKFIDPLLYTKKAAQHRRLKEYAATHTEDNSITSHIPAPSNFHGPYIKPVSKEEADKATNERAERIINLQLALTRALADAPRLLLQKVIARMREGITAPRSNPQLLADDRIEDWKQWTSTTEAQLPLSLEEFNLLSILTERSWDSNLSGRRFQVKDAHPEDRFSTTPAPNLGIPTIVRYNGDGEEGPLITMDSWAVFQRLGYRLGAESAQLFRSRLQSRTSPEHIASEKIQEAKLRDLIINQFPDLSIDEIIKPLLPPGQVTSTWTPAEKTSVLRTQLIQESLRADTDRTLNHKALWAFAEKRLQSQSSGQTQARQFFSVSRWPPEVMSAEQRLDMQEAAPVRDRNDEPVPLTPEELAALERANVAAYFAEPPRERFIRGVPFYPFGETKVQEWILSNEISRDLAGVPGYDMRPKKKEGFFSKLNPVRWFGKRKAGDDGNSGAGKRRAVGGGSSSGSSSSSSSSGNTTDDEEEDDDDSIIF